MTKLRTCLVLFLLFTAKITFAQNKGIDFGQYSSWKEVMETAKKTGKYIFVDCNTTWCMPCKMLDQNIFPKPEVGDYMNRHFLNIKVQMDRTDSDNEFVKTWYNDADNLSKVYEVKAYPTLLFIDPNGKLIYRTTGYNPSPQLFIASAQIAIEPDKAMDNMLKRFNEGIRDTAMLRFLAIGAKNEGNFELGKSVSEAYASTMMKTFGKTKDLKIYKKIADFANAIGMDSIAHVYANKYIAASPMIFNKEHIAYMVRYTGKLSDPGFKYFITNTTQINKVMGEVSYNYAVDVAKNIIIRDHLEFKTISKNKAMYSNWVGLEKKLALQYTPLIANKTTGYFKRTYYKEREQWPEYITALVSFITKYPLSITEAGYNIYAWEVFEHSNDPEQLKAALEWVKRTLVSNQIANYDMAIDTYANILHKLGRTKDAIVWEERAITLASNIGNKQVYEKTLEKMKKGEKTW